MPIQLTELGTPILTEYAEVITDVLSVGGGKPYRLALDAVLAANIFLGQDAGPQWGLFKASGIVAVQGETVVGFDYRREAQVADFPVEKGGFGSYNKVQRPYDVKITIAQASDVETRKDFIEQCENVLNSLDLYFAITPEFYFPDLNVVDVEYRRTRERGCSMICADLHCRQIRQVQAGQTTIATDNANAVADPASANPTNGGTRQTTTPTAAQRANFNPRAHDGAGV